MNNTLIDICEVVETNRQNGKTSILAKAVEDAGGVLIVDSDVTCQKLKSKYPNLNCVTPNTNLLRGISQPIFIDHYCLYVLAKKMQTQYDQELKDLKNRYSYDIRDNY